MCRRVCHESTPSSRESMCDGWSGEWIGRSGHEVPAANKPPFTSRPAESWGSSAGWRAEYHCQSAGVAGHTCIASQFSLGKPHSGSYDTTTPLPLPLPEFGFVELFFPVALVSFWWVFPAPPFADSSAPTPQLVSLWCISPAPPQGRTAERLIPVEFASLTPKARKW